MIRLAILGHCFFLFAPVSLGQFTHTIHDNRLTGLSLTNKIGFGYDEASNHIFSSCLSYENTLDRSYSVSSYTYLLGDNFDSQALIGQSTYRHQALRFIANAAHPEEEWDQELNKKVSLTKVLFHIKMQSLQFIPDVSFRLRNASRSLLLRQDWETFFRLCGTAFIHSFTKGANYLAILTYRNLGAEDEYFLERLRQNIHRLYEPQVEDPDFERQLKRRRLRVTDLAIGLPHQHVTSQTLNLDKFRKKLLQVNSLMTHESAGLVEAIEINHWHEYADFIEYIPWEAQAGWQHINLLAENGRFISKMHVKEENLKSRLWKAELCSSQLRENFPVGNGPDQYDPDQTFFMHHKKPNPQHNIKLSEFINRLLEDNLVKKIKKYYRKFKEGEVSSNTEGLNACLSELRTNFIGTYFNEIPACVQTQALPQLDAIAIESYCLPRELPT